MYKWALISGVIALVAGVLGFTMVVGAAAAIAKFLFFAFLLLFVVLLILGLSAARKINGMMKRKE